MTLPPRFDNDFPSYLKDLSVKDINVYWFHPDFTQSRYPPGQEMSEACTLICLLVAQRISQSGLQLRSVENCPMLRIFIAESIVEGNKTHSQILRRGLVPHPYLNTEEALTYGGRRLRTLKEWKFQVFEERIGRKLYHDIQTFLTDWYKKPKADTLIMLLITCGRTILLLFQQQINMVTLFDSHSHVTTENPHRGLVVAQAKFQKLHSLCDWYVDAVLNNCFNAQSDRYELAFLYYSQSSKCCDACDNNNEKLHECGCKRS
ncbi:hypothetical protein PV325_011450 [Microctonus aethiopoides]|nr:hypothetical protein PV325_011450 [Microctonus aethiopoides]KAK0094254.1 hypothetical protein PV326_011422 [Microctonus aethiopoides]